MANVNFVQKRLLGFGSKFFFFLVALLMLWNLGLGMEIKYPNVAGTFYPDNPEELARLVDNFLNLADPQATENEVFALISPHAGYGFSGKAAAYGYKLIKNKPYKTVVVLGTSHYYAFSGVSVFPEGIFRTPLGDLEIDSEFAKSLLNKDKEIIFERRAFAKEHSVEVQLPFLQRALSAKARGEYDWKLVPIVMGDCPFYTCEALAKLLKEAIGSRKDVLIIASTDMYHGYDFQEAEEIDKQTLKVIKNMDAQELYNGLRQGKLQLCGGFGVVSTLILAKQFGLDKLNILKYTNSSYETGKRTQGIWTVGYASCLVERQEQGDKPMLNQIQRKKLLEIARNSIHAYLLTKKKLEISETDPVLLKELGAFVTLHKQAELRGCIGNLIAKSPLYLTIRDMAVEAAVDDPRFPAVELAELKNLEIEISVLSPLEKIDSPEAIELGKHGVLVRKGIYSGVFLPQVATETGWSKEEFLSNLCAHKAGLSPLAWKDKSVEIYIFTAEVFSEKKIQTNE